MKPTYFITLLLYLVVVDVVQSSDDPTSNINDLFSDFKTRKTPLYRCPNVIEGINYRLPRKLDCASPNMTENSTIIQVTTYWSDFAIKVKDGYECFIQTQTFTQQRHLGWGGFYVIDTKTDPIYNFVSLTECLSMKNEHVTTNGEKLFRESQGSWETKNIPNPETGFFTPFAQETVTNYFLKLIKYTVDNKDATIKPVGTSLKESCTVVKDSCATVRGRLLFESSKYLNCRVKIGRKSTCVRTGNRISCPDVNLALIEISETTMCGKAIAESSQGVHFSSERRGEIFPNVGNTDDMIDHINLVNKGRRHQGRRRRDLNPEVGFVSRIEFDAGMQWLYDTIKEGTKVDLWNLHDAICKNNRMMLTQLEVLASSGNPTASVITLLGDGAYRAKLVGDAISIWRCEEVREYYFVPMENCSLTQPLRYLYKHDHKFGYMRPISHEIVDTPGPETKCPAPAFYFEYDGEMINLHDRTVAGNMDYLPNPGDSVGVKSLPEIAIKPGSIYTSEDFGSASLLDMLGSLSSSMTLQNGISKLQKNQRLNDDEKRSFDLFTDYNVGNVLSTIFIILNIIIAIGIGTALVVAYIYLDTVLKPFKFFYKHSVGKLLKTNLVVSALAKATKEQTETCPKNDTVIDIVDNENFVKVVEKGHRVGGVNNFNAEGQNRDDVNTPPPLPNRSDHMKVYPNIQNFEEN